jgi:hypothetical protein
VIIEPKPLSAARKTQLFYQRKKRCKTCGAKLSRKAPPCPDCTKPRHSSKTLCGLCAHQHAHRTSSSKRALIAAGKCSQCAAEPLAPNSKRLGAACLQLHNDRTNQLRRNHQALGLCRDCGEPAGGFTRCYWCRQRQWLQNYCRRMRPYWARRYEESQQPEPEEVWHWNGWEWEVQPAR